MGFYYGPGSQPPDDKPGSLKEALAITWVVFSLLAKPLALLFGGVIYILVLFWLFAFHPLAGLAGLAVPVAGITARGIWEWRHPPELR